MQMKEGRKIKKKKYQLEGVKVSSLSRCCRPLHRQDFFEPSNLFPRKERPYLQNTDDDDDEIRIEFTEFISKSWEKIRRC